MRARPMLAFLPFAACTAADPDSLPGGAPPPPPPNAEATTSYYRDIQPLLERSCHGCHSAGGVAPLAFDQPEAARALAPAIEGAVRSGRMPPFYASADCNTYARDPRLSSAERALLATWAAEGAPLGDPGAAVHAEVVRPAPVREDRLLDLGGDFDARAMEQSDNYRCFVMDPQAGADLLVSGYEVRPGNRALVHHVLAYVVRPSDLAELDRLDAADPGLGYTCQSGGVGIAGAVGNQIASWVPGAGPTHLPEGTGLELAQGSKLVVQIHYNLAAVALGASPYDRTQLVLELAPAGSLETARILPMLKRDLAIPAYQAPVVQESSLRIPRTYEGTRVFNLTGHMHMLGTEVRLEVVHAAGGSTCLLHIPDWDFNWQRTYDLVTPYVVASGDTLRLTCVYDNSAANQPVVGGAQQTPRDVAWGEGSLDEMCMTYLTFTPTGR